MYAPDPLRHGDPCRYLRAPPPVSTHPVEGAPERQARRPTRSDGRARERQAGRLLPAPACVGSARRGCHSRDALLTCNRCSIGTRDEGGARVCACLASGGGAGGTSGSCREGPLAARGNYLKYVFI